MRLTVGPLPPAVYWRRRAIVLGAVLVMLFLVAQACMSASASPEDAASGNPAAPATNPPATNPPATSPPVAGSPPATAPASAAPEEPGESPPSASPDGGNQQTGAVADPDDPDTCTDEEMRITAETTRESFPAGTSVQFTIRIRNGGDRSCDRDIGGDHRELYLRKETGASKLWSSRDCGGPSGSEVRELEPGFETSYFIVWHGRSSNSCSGDEPAGGQVEPGEYELVARLGTAYSDPVGITVTG